jgi:diketogulonate reductase-like aldo/keto reductase
MDPARREHESLALPPMGLGMYRLASGGEARQAVVEAIRLGYRLFDTSLAYGNEPDLAAGLRESGIAREDVFITTKLENDDHGYDNALRGCDRSLRNLRTDHLDLYLIHWPVPGRRKETWRALERLHEEGVCRAIGVSNYTVRHLEELFAHAEVPPAVDQVEFHPWLYDRELLDYCHHRRVVLEAYSPLAKASLFGDAALQGVAAATGATAAQVLLAWSMAHGAVPIPKASSAGHLRENLDARQLKLSHEQVIALDRLNEGRHLDWDPTDLE